MLFFSCFCLPQKNEMSSSVNHASHAYKMFEYDGPERFAELYHHIKSINTAADALSSNFTLRVIVIVSHQVVL